MAELDFPAGAPCWVDLNTSDPERSKAFYTELLGWTAEEGAPEFGGYVNFSLNGRLVAGVVPPHPEQPPINHWNIYLRVDDARKTVEGVADSGGSVMVPAMDVGNLGTMAVVVDPAGAAIGLWQPGAHQGFGALAEVGAPGWFELYARDYRGAVQFYESALEWDAKVMSDTPEFRYTTLGEGEAARAGIMDAAGFLPEGVPSYWAVYFIVADADAAAAKATELGATIVRGPEDTPYGRLVELVDPNGANVKLMGTR
jgi:predicted enzyme related to lactoylglutathione lyase